MLIVDASQLIGHKTIDLSKTPCDILCAPSHKALFGIQGAGFAVFCDDVIRKTLFEGGSGSLSKSPEMPTVLPERFEAGTLSAPAIISLIKGIEFIEDVGLENIECRLSFLSSCIADRLKSIKEVVIHDYSNGVISFNVLGMPASDVSEELNKYGVCTRSGLHCAPLAHRRQGTESIGSVRVSLSYFNTKHEADKFYKIIKEVVKTK